MPDDNKLTIVIIGAGIAGLAAVISLQRHERIDVQIYERAPELQEVGASIALGPNGMRALERLGVEHALSDDLAFRNKSGYPMIYRHWKTNEVISVDGHHNPVPYRHRTSRFYRPHLQQALAKHVGQDRLHFRKTFKFVAHASGTDELTVSFADGTTTRADLILGADGIHSAVRHSFVPTSKPKWTGWVAFRSVFENKLVEHIPGVLGEAYHSWGPDRTFFSSRLGKDCFTIVGGTYSDPDASNALYKDSTWNSEGSLDELAGFYNNWHPNIRQMTEASPYTRMYPNTFASALDTWIHRDGRVTFAGDAAHAHGRAFATGGSLALDDAWAFARAMFHVFPTDESQEKPDRVRIRDALRIYEKTRK